MTIGFGLDQTLAIAGLTGRQFGAILAACRLAVPPIDGSALAEFIGTADQFLQAGGTLGSAAQALADPPLLLTGPGGRFRREWPDPAEPVQLTEQPAKPARERNWSGAWPGDREILAEQQEAVPSGLQPTANSPEPVAAGPVGLAVSIGA